jgi:membrane-bound metal-dependent hydrolase YbcI (DUF457 family)
MGTDHWQQYCVVFDPQQSEVEVAIGPVVTTGQVPIPGSTSGRRRTGRATVQAAILHTYDDEIKIDIFHGPTFAFDRAGQKIQVTFLPWHRAWTHSMLMALIVGMLGALLSPVYGLVMALAILAHALGDQLGYMGCNFFPPLSGRRAPGLGLFHSGDALVNLVVVWVSIALVVFNLDRFSASPALSSVPYILGAIVLPTLALLAAGLWSRFRSSQLLPAAMAAIEALDETDEVDI